MKILRFPWLPFATVGFCSLTFAAPPPPQADIDKAIEKGVKVLKTHLGMADSRKDRQLGKKDTDALVLYTLAVAKASKNLPIFDEVLKSVLAWKLDNTYCVALLAMTLAEHDPDKYRGEIGRCAQYLVDNQCVNGQWDYGEETPVADAKAYAGRKPVKTPSAAGAAAPEATAPRTAIRRRELKVRPNGDNSNTQYALLGLRAGADAGFDAPADTWNRALAWWTKVQRPDGGWNYGQADWLAKEGSYPGMTEGGLGSVILCLHHLRKDRGKAAAVEKANQCVAAKFSLEDNVLGREGGVKGWQYYHLYALQRAGRLAETGVFGKRDWYAEGAAYLLSKQKADGTWLSALQNGDGICDTCFAVLFLARATRPVVYSKTATDR